MTRHGTVLPIPDDYRIQLLIDEWPDGFGGHRSWWLRVMESLLRACYMVNPPPQAYNSRDVNVTARSLAPFPLAEPTRYIG